MGAEQEAVRVYGRVVGHGSHARVTAGFAGVLGAAERLAGVHALDREPLPDEPAAAGAMAPFAVLTGPLALSAAKHTNAAHRWRFAVVAPNSDRLPRSLVEPLQRDCTHLLAPSEWAAGVLRAHFELPIWKAPHGVDTAFQPDAQLREAVRRAYAEGYFDVLHLSSSERERKGTAELIEAWRLLMTRGTMPPRARLLLVLDYPAEVRLREWLADHPAELPAGVTIRTRGDWSPADMARVYSSVHAVCQPSRGEAFGMVVPEARACGVPVAFTADATGHTEHSKARHPGCTMRSGSECIEVGPPEPIDDQPGAVAPSVRPEAIAAALAVQYETWLMKETSAFERASEFGAAWAWDVQLADWMQGMKEIVDANE